MARLDKKLFSVKLNGLEELGRNLGKQTAKYDVVMEKRMDAATSLVWRIAHQKRPMITKQAAAKGRFTKMGNISYNRVSDPNAALGVPVDTGLLQSSIKKEVKRLGYGKFQGEVYVDTSMVSYGKAMEYGTATVHARPFLRPAIALTKEALRALFAKQF